MPFVNDSKNSSITINDSLDDSGLVWNEMTGTWDEVEGTWDAPRRQWTRDSANTSVATNDAKV